MDANPIGGREGCVMSKGKIIHLGPEIEGLAELIEGKFDIFDVPFEFVDQPIGEEKNKLLIKGELNLVFRHDLFLLLNRNIYNLVKVLF